MLLRSQGNSCEELRHGTRRSTRTSSVRLRTRKCAQTQLGGVPQGGHGSELNSPPFCTYVSETRGKASRKDRQVYPSIANRPNLSLPLPWVLHDTTSPWLGISLGPMETNQKCVPWSVLIIPDNSSSSKNPCYWLKASGNHGGYAIL